MLSQIRKLVRLASPYQPPPHPPATLHLDTEAMVERAAMGMAYYLGLDEESARIRARAASERRQRRRSGQLRSDRPLVSPEHAGRRLRQALDAGSCLLSLPFSWAALRLLDELANDGSLPLILVESPAVSVMHADMGAAVGDLPRCPSREVIKHVKVQVSQRQAAVYVTFPELHALTTGTTANAIFLGKACRLSMLDPFLCLYGLKTILTINHFPTASGTRPELVSYDTTAIDAQDGMSAISVLLRWSLKHLEASASLSPDDTLSWHHLYRASMHCHQIERSNRIKQLDAYFEAWNRSPYGIPVPVHETAMERLAALRDAR